MSSSEEFVERGRKEVDTSNIIKEKRRTKPVDIAKKGYPKTVSAPQTQGESQAAHRAALILIVINAGKRKKGSTQKEPEEDADASQDKNHRPSMYNNSLDCDRQIRHRFRKEDEYFIEEE